MICGRLSVIPCIAAVALAAAVTIAAQTQRPGQVQRPARDTPAQQPATQAVTPQGRIAGRVLTADTGRPVKRARVLVTAAELPGGRGVLTTDDGAFEIVELPAGRYTVTVSKTGFISLSYGQRRPLQAGTPLQLLDGQALTSVDFRLPRGSVIAGRVYDETGDPLPGANVRVMRYDYAQGSRQLVPVGNGVTDDQGAYRVWGLNPGDYYVSATARSFDFGGRGGGPVFGGPGGAFPPGLARGGGPGGRGGGPNTAFVGRGGGAVQAAIDASTQAFGAPDGTPPEALAYAPTFYPGVPSASEARPVNVALGAEASDINFSLLLVRTARITGRVTNPDGTATTAGVVNLTPEGEAGRSAPGMALGSRIQWDGAFAIGNVPPGRYVLRARGDDTTQPQFAQQPLTLADGDLTELTVVLAAGARISGSLTFQSTASQQAPSFNQVRVTAPAADFTGLGPNPVARVEPDGTFTLDGVAAGLHLIRPQGPMRGWTLKTVSVGGRDVTDTPIDLRSGQTTAGVTLVFTDKLSEVNGTMTDDRGAPITDTVLAFPTDSTFWRPQARQIMTARPDQTGKYQIRGLPPGDYYLAAVDPSEPGEWFEPTFLQQHVSGAARFSLGEGDVKTQDFSLTIR